MVQSTLCLAFSVDAWCVKFDKKIVTYVNSTGKGYKEDFDFEELEAAIELYKEHEDEDKYM